MHRKIAMQDKKAGLVGLGQAHMTHPTGFHMGLTATEATGTIS